MAVFLTNISKAAAPVKTHLKVSPEIDTEQVEARTPPWPLPPSIAMAAVFSARRPALAKKSDASLEGNADGFLILRAGMIVGRAIDDAQVQLLLLHIMGWDMGDK